MSKCDRPLAAPACVTYPRTKRHVRISLALFAVTNFCMGVAFFMFLLCSSSPHHRLHLELLFTNPSALFDHEHPGTHYDMAD
jgi:hypothetical protein